MGKEITRITNNTLNLLSIAALSDVYKDHLLLGARGIEKVRTNRFGDTALVGDYRAEEIIINAVRQHKIPIRIISEEHGTIDLGDKYLGILDGLDGSNRYLAYINGDKRARYGTMFSIFKGSDPKYDDVISSGIMEHPSDTLFFLNGNKAFGRNLSTGVTTRLYTSGRTNLDESTRTIINTHSEAPFHHLARELVDELPKEFEHYCLLSTEAAFVDLISGRADLVIEWTRKNNLEFAVAYGLIKAAGGVMLDSNGNSIGPQKYLSFEQKEYSMIVCASTLDLARSFLKSLE